MTFRFPAHLLLCLALIALAPAMAKAQSSWTVSLTNKQANEFKSLTARPGNTAFAISPDGPYGFRYGASSKDVAGNDAIANCRAFLKPGRRDCILYAVNGRVVARPVVQTRKVKAVYKPIDGKAAPTVFGRANVSFIGNRKAALADLAALEANPAHRRKLSRDRVLESALLHRSFMNTQKRGFVIWFDKGHGEQLTSGNNGAIRLTFKDWVATRDGLVCMFDSVWDTGKPIGTRCLIMDRIEKGAADFVWPGSGHGTATVRKGQIIAGDARKGAVR